MYHKVAIRIDGGFFFKRFKVNNQGKTVTDILFRTFYYDCRPYGDVQTDPNDNIIDFGTKPKFIAANDFLNKLRTFLQMALRLGDLSFEGWKIDAGSPGKYIPEFKQKSVDIKPGLDKAWMPSKKTVDKIVLVAGDSDFITPMKFSGREGILVYLYPMGQQRIKATLKEHADFIF